MRDSQLVPDLAHISFAAVVHHAGPADDFEIGDLRQLGQNVVLHTIGKDRVFFLVAQIFKRKNGDSSCYRLPDQFTFPNDPARSCCQSDQGRCKQRAGWIASHPFSATRENPSVTRYNRLVL